MSALGCLIGWARAVEPPTEEAWGPVAEPSGGEAGRRERPPDPDPTPAVGGKRPQPRRDAPPGGGVLEPPSPASAIAASQDHPVSVTTDAAGGVSDPVAIATVAPTTSHRRGSIGLLTGAN